MASVVAGSSGRRGAAYATGWLVAATAVLALDALPGDTTSLIVAGVSALSIALGVVVFMRHGGDRVTVAGIHSLVFAVLVGFAGCYLVLNPSSRTSPGYLLAAVLICYVGQVMTWAICWAGQDPPAPPVRFADRPSLSTVAIGAGLLLAALFVLDRVDASGVARTACGFVGAVLIAVGTQRAGPGHRVLWCVPAAAAFAVYYTYLFGGWGRIVVVSLALAMLMALSHRLAGRFVKLATLAAAAPVLIALTKIQGVSPGLTGVPRERGIGSVVSPLECFAMLLAQHRDGSLPLGWGRTFAAAAVALVPRALWPDKPVGFGAELVAYVSPDLTGTIHSDAALFQGEWLFNFGLPGLALMVAVTGLFVRWLDGLLVRAVARPLGNLRDNLRYAAMLVAVTGVIDLAWLGSFGYVARAGSRLAVLGVILLGVWSLRLRADDAAHDAAHNAAYNAAPGAASGRPAGDLASTGRSP